MLYIGKAEQEELMEVDMDIAGSRARTLLRPFTPQFKL
jgi:hypothetical protein